MPSPETMETRKLQEVGGGTYTVSVPKEWADDQRVEAGSTVHLYTHVDGSIVLRSTEKDGGNLATSRVEVDGEAPELVERALRAAHAIGFDSVTLVPTGSFTETQRRAAESAVRRLVGTEIFVDRDDEVTVRNLLDASNVSIRQSVVQLQFVALSMHRRATAAFLDADSDSTDRLRERHAETDRLFGMVARHFNRSLLSLAEVDRLDATRPELYDYYETARQLEGVADQAVRIARTSERLADSLPDALAADVEAAADAARRVVEDATTAALTGTDVGTAHDALDRRDETLADVDAIDSALFDGSTDPSTDSTTDALALTRMLDNLARTAAAGGTIAEVALRADRRAATR